MNNSFIFIILLLYADNFNGQTQSFSNLYRNNLRKMVKILDDNEQPCDDYFQHACGNFNKYTQSDTSDEPEKQYDSPPPFLYNQEDRMHFFEENKAHFRTKPGIILSNLYSNCKERTHYDVIHGGMPPRWQRLIQEIHFLAKDAELYRNWPFLNHQWGQLNMNDDMSNMWVILAANFAAHGVATFLNIFFAENTIFIAPETPKCPSLEQVKESLRTIVQQNERNPQIADIIGNELYRFCMDLIGSQPPLSGDTNALDDDSVDILIDNNTVAYFQQYFSILNFSETEVAEARKIPIEVKRLSDILALLKATEPRTLFNFVLWHAYEQLKYEDCFLLTEEFEDLLFSEYWQWHVFEPHFSRDLAMATYLFHSTRFQRYRRETLMGEHWDRFLLEKFERKDFNIERSIKQYANTVLNSDNLAIIYGKVPLAPKAFYMNLLALRHLRLRNSFFGAIVDGEDINHPLYFLRQFLHFSILILKQPLYHYFATQGLQMWHASNLLYSSDGLYSALDCLARQSLLLEHADPFSASSKMLSIDEVEQIYRFHCAFMEAFRDYHFWLEGESFAFAEDFVLGYFKLKSERIMFYAVAQQYCGRNDVAYRAQINRSFMNMPEFREAFNCSAEATMNPPDKCMIRTCH